MAKMSLVKGTTSYLARIFIQDSSSLVGAGLTGLTSGSAGLVCYRARDDDGNAGGTAIALSAGTRGTWSSGGFVEKDATNLPGVYEIGIPNAALATGSKSALIGLKGATNMAPAVLEFELTGNDNQDAVGGGMSKITALTYTVANQVDSNVIDWKGAAAPAMTGDAFARLGAPAGASVSADIAAVKVDTAAILVALPANFSTLSISGGAVKIQSGIKKNTALAKFEFLLTDSVNHNPVTGKVVTATRSIDAGAFAAGTLSAVTEIGVGIYSVDFAAADLNGGVITLQCTAAGSDTTFVTIITDA